MKEKSSDFIQALRRRNAAAQQLLLTQYGGMVYNRICRIVPRREDAEEVYQDVFIKALQEIGSYDEERASVATWLCRIAYNESLNFLRKRKLNIEYAEERELSLNSQQDEAPEDEDLNEQIIQLMENALQLLAPDERALLSMFYSDELSLNEIAYITGSIPSTVGSRLHRIRKKLYRIIKPQIR